MGDGFCAKEEGWKEITDMIIKNNTALFALPHSEYCLASDLRVYRRAPCPMPGVGGKTRPFFSLKHNSSGNTSGHSYKEKEILTIFPLKKPCTHTEHKKLFYNLYTSRIKCKLRTCILYTWTNPRTMPPNEVQNLKILTP